MPPYWIGISQPANSTIFAPSASWRSSSGVGVGAIGSISVMPRSPPPSIASGNVPSVAATPARATSARSVSNVSSEGASSKPIQRTSSNSWSWRPRSPPVGIMRK